MRNSQFLFLIGTLYSIGGDGGVLHGILACAFIVLSIMFWFSEMREDDDK